jgi:hypothetical protein
VPARIWSSRNVANLSLVVAHYGWDWPGLAPHRGGNGGDKGNRLNVSVITYHPDAWPILLGQVTEARVSALFRHRDARRIGRSELPRLQALRFTIDDALEGGVNGSLALDEHTKMLPFRVLGLIVEVPDDLAARIARGPATENRSGGTAA